MNINALVADIGGTNIRLGVADLSDLSISDIVTYQCQDFTNVELAIERYFEQTGHQVTQACIDVATAVTGDQVSLTNNHWSFSQQALQAKFGWQHLRVINDFTAIAMSVPHLTDEQKIQIGGDLPQQNKPIAIYGAGTGLGVAHLVHTGDKWLAIDGEGGHVDFAPIDQDEINVLQQLQKKYTRVSAEQILSGSGLVQIYQALCAAEDIETKYTAAAEITQQALSSNDQMAVRSLQLFCRALGSFGGNLALTVKALGGVYIAGGIVPRFIEYVKNSDFRTRFDAKGRFGSLIETIPVYVVTEAQPGLIGCAAYLQQEI